jgi:dihydrofolate reductase
MSPVLVHRLRCMTDIVIDLTTSLDGYVAGPDPTLTDPLGANGMQLHEWLFATASFQAQHGGGDGERSADDDRVAASLARVGAQVIGRRMFSGGDGPWADDPNADGWFGAEPPFRVPVFVVTHHPRETREYPNGTSFVFVEGVEEAVARAREAAGRGDVRIAGGASVAQQALRAGLVDRIDLHVVPVLLGGGTRLFEGGDFPRLELVETAGSARVSHLVYRPVR